MFTFAERWADYFLFFFLLPPPPPPPPPPEEDVADVTEDGEDGKEDILVVVVGFRTSSRGLMGRGEVGEESDGSSALEGNETGGARLRVVVVDGEVMEEGRSTATDAGGDSGLKVEGGGVESSSSKLSKSASSKRG